jgi:signal peptide peptidase SppA
MIDHLLARVYNQPHLCRPEKLEAISRVMVDRWRGIRADAPLLAELRAANQERRRPVVSNSVAVLPILGTLAKRGGMIEDSSGMASTDMIGREFDRLMADESVGSILLDVDSPGGEVFGVPELADKIFAARGRKPIEASVNAEMASGALWIGTAADRVNITPSGWIGSLGVYMAHTDVSAWNEAEGVRVTYISAGDYKVEGNSDAPLTEEAAAYYQEQVNVIYDQFIAAVARNRGVSKSIARENYGKGRMLQAQQAMGVGLVDRIETLDQTMQRMAGGGKRRASTRVESAWLELEAMR